MSVAVKQAEPSELRNMLGDACSPDFVKSLRWTDELWMGFVDGKLACAWGLIPPCMLSLDAYIWLYSNDLVEEHKFIFMRKSKIAVEDLLKRYRCLVGHVEVSNTRAFPWLRWLGAKFGDPQGKAIPFTIGEPHGA